jgi:hypothetical protein
VSEIFPACRLCAVMFLPAIVSGRKKPSSEFE